jgi:ribonuclease Y
MNPIWIAALALLVGGSAGYAAKFFLGSKSKDSLEKSLKAKQEAAEIEAKAILVTAKDKATQIISEAQNEEKERKQELRRLEDRLAKKEDQLNEERSSTTKEREKNAEESKKILEKEEELKRLRAQAIADLERLSGLSSSEAKQKMILEIQEASREELARLLAKLEREKEQTVEARAAEIVTTVIQRYARDRIADATTSLVPLPSEDLKGKIIGREGRNVRAFERATGTEVIVDETPEGIVISSFDPLRRELAKLSLEKLIRDGRIQPARIEEVVEQTRAELDNHIQKVGEDAAFEVGILDFPKEIIHLLGRLNYRTSYGQNVLQHSVEVAHLAGMIASELGLNVMVAKKGALVHDLGKAIDHEVEGTHVDLGRKLLKKYGVDEAVIKAMEAHHDEYPYAIPEAYVVTAADAISAARPGARRDTLEKYLKRLEDIENIVKSFDGVKQAFAVSAGREVRVFVTPEKIDDFGSFQLAKQISGRIQSDLQYPGEIKVVVIREVRAIEFAR